MMGYVVGVDFGSVFCLAGIVKWDNGFPSTPECVRVTGPVRSVAYVNSDGTLLLGNSALDGGERNPQRVIRDFKRRLGDPVPIMVDDWSEHAENVVAAVIRQIVDDIAADEGARPDGIAVTHPAGWGPFKQELLSAALAAAGLADVLLVCEPAAALTNTTRVAPSDWRTFIVYDLGAGSFEAAVMARGGGARSDHSSFELLGHPQGMEWLGGSDFDQAIFSRVQHAAGLKNLDTTDADVLAAMSRLRRDCTAAKELLSIDTEATVTVSAAGRGRRIRLVRSEFEELIRDAIDDTVDITHRAIASAGLAVQDIDAIVLVGGSSRIPLVAQVISAEFSLPIIVDATPEASTSLGAAWLARAVLQARFAAALAADAADAPATAGAAEAAGTDDAASAADAERVERAPIPMLTAPLMAPTVSPADAPPGPPPMVGPSAPISAPPPVPGPGGSVGPGGRPDQLDRRGRHRRRGISRYWIHVAGIIGAVVVIVSAGSALATSQASDQNSPAGSRQANRVGVSTTTIAAITANTGATPTTVTPAATTPPPITPTPTAPTPTAPTPTTPDPAAPDPAAPDPAAPDPAVPGSTPSTVPWLVPDVPSNSVGAPAVIVDLSELLPSNPADTEPTTDVSGTGVSVATP